MAKRITAEKREEIVRAYLSDGSMSYKALAERFGIATESARRIVGEYLQSGDGIKPDRRAPQENLWMEHITPLHKRKMELEAVIEHKQAELDKAKQEYRDFLATLKGLLESTI